MLPEAPAHCSLCHLAHTQPFPDLDPIALANYDEIGSMSMFSSAEMLFREQQRADRVIVLYRGHVKLSCTSKDGRSMILKIAAPGHVLGLSAALSAKPFEVSAQAIDTVTAKSIGRTAFVDFIERHRGASLQVAISIAAEYKTAFDDVRRLGLSASVPARLASLLMDWRTAPALGQPETRFQMLHSHDDIASIVATSRESVTRTLSKFRQDRYIHMQGIWMRILEPEKMARLAV